MRLWGGRFSEPSDPRLVEFTRSIEVDAALAADDIAGSIAHVRGLGRAAILSQAEVEELVNGLTALAGDVAAGADRLGPRASRTSTSTSRLRWPRRSDPSPASCIPGGRATIRSPRICGSGPAGRSTSWMPR